MASLDLTDPSATITSISTEEKDQEEEEYHTTEVMMLSLLEKRQHSIGLADNKKFISIISTTHRSNSLSTPSPPAVPPRSAQSLGQVIDEESEIYVSPCTPYIPPKKILKKQFARHNLLQPSPPPQTYEEEEEEEDVYIAIEPSGAFRSDSCSTDESGYDYISSFIDDTKKRDQGDDDYESISSYIEEEDRDYDTIPSFINQDDQTDDYSMIDESMSTKETSDDDYEYIPPLYTTTNTTTGNDHKITDRIKWSVPSDPECTYVTLN